MPTYTYMCQQWGTKFETFASIKKKVSGWRPECPTCGSPQTRQITVPGCRGAWPALIEGEVNDD